MLREIIKLIILCANWIMKIELKIISLHLIFAKYRSFFLFSILFEYIELLYVP